MIARGLGILAEELAALGFEVSIYGGPAEAPELLAHAKLTREAAALLARARLDRRPHLDQIGPFGEADPIGDPDPGPDCYGAMEDR